MRPLSVIIFAIVVLGGLYGFLKIIERPIEAIDFVEYEAEGEFTLELTLPFDAAPNEFNPFDAEGKIVDDGIALSILLAKEVVVESKTRVKAGVQTYGPISGIKVGRNEFVVNIQPAKQNAAGGGEFSLGDETDGTGKQAVPVATRLRIFRNKILLDEKTIWNEPGMPIVGSFMIEIDADQLESLQNGHRNGSGEH